ncbi:hypothetical protein LI226_21850, partial [Parabacteroides distasonis]|nr:hypothetical protein [Parabacteroides distasonis]
MNYRELMQKKNVRPYVLMARFGLEKENQRSTREGLLATTDHPTVFGNRSYHP